MDPCRPRPASTAMAKSVCVVGAGPSGLVAAKTLLHNAPQGAFSVTVMDGHDAVGGLWPSSPADAARQVHPLMLANQSRHTMHFSDLAWEPAEPQMPRAWMVGRYLGRYLDRYLAPHPGFRLRLGTRVVGAEPRDGRWHVRVDARGRQETMPFDYLVVASGYFGRPIIPDGFSRPASVPVIHSSQYRDLRSLFENGASAKGSILVVGGQMSGVEIAGTIAAHLSSAVHPTDEHGVPGIHQCSVHHIVQRPTWVFPLFTTPEPDAAAVPFLPVDCTSYNRSNRPLPLANAQGHIGVEAAKRANAACQQALGSDQSALSPLMHVDAKAKAEPPHLAISDWYCDFVRQGLITLSKGRAESLEGNTAVLSPGGAKVDDVVAVVLATGFDPSPCLSFLPQHVLEKLHRSPRHTELPLALAFHGTHHPDVPGLGFVGFYRSPYWGVMQMQARFLAEFWSRPEALPDALVRKLASDDSIQRTLALRDDPRLSQFPMGDYPWLMQEMAEALSIEITTPPSLDRVRRLPHNNQPLDMLAPARYPSPTDDGTAREEAARSVQDTVGVIIDGLGTPRFVSRAVFRSLLGTWKLERDLTSRLASHPSGHFSGTARFLLREKTSDGMRCASDGTPASPDDDGDMEYLYIEDGEFQTDAGFGFRATRRYVWRYDERRDVISVWFAKTDDPKRADYLFHDIEFQQPSQGGRGGGWRASAGHLCIDDYYDVKYEFAFAAVNLAEWRIEYTVKGPRKDYTILGTYRR